MFHRRSAVLVCCDTSGWERLRVVIPVSIAPLLSKAPDPGLCEHSVMFSAEALTVPGGLVSLSVSMILDDFPKVRVKILAKRKSEH